MKASTTILPSRVWQLEKVMGIANQFARHETVVGKGKGKGQFSVHSCFSSWFLIRMHKRE